ncbi:MAG: hypothetical protein FJZ57_03955 [Chlamydiae bacterium]|nr:hypothetical protein [Chlamydiota bacterium]
MHAGNAVIKNREDGIKGTVVELIIPCSSSPESTEDLDLEVDVKLAEFYKWKESCVDGKVIVIVDDSLIIMKMLFQKIFSILTESKNRSSLFNQVRKHEFEEKGLFFDVFNKTAILCCSNAELAFSVIQKVEICGLITDVQMLGKYDGVGLVSRIREYEKCKQKASIPIVLHSALTASELQSYNPEVVNMHVDYMSKEMDYHQLEKWISSWIEQS